MVHDLKEKRHYRGHNCLQLKTVQMANEMTETKEETNTLTRDKTEWKHSRLILQKRIHRIACPLNKKNKVLD